MLYGTYGTTVAVVVRESLDIILRGKKMEEYIKYLVFYAEGLTFLL